MTRLDRALVERGLARSRTQAQQLVVRGDVRVNGSVVTRPAATIADSDSITAVPDRYVSRAAHKLLGALDDLGVRPGGRALDAGASVGGFTQVLLEGGCLEVYAVDVGRDQLAPALLADPRVHVRERTNLRDLSLDEVGNRRVDLVVADVSFISLTLLMGPLTRVLDPSGTLLVMIKPQFEVGRALLGRDGVVRRPELHLSAVRSVIAAAENHHWFVHAVSPSRLPGPAGNREFFALFRTAHAERPVDLAALVAQP